MSNIPVYLDFCGQTHHLRNVVQARVALKAALKTKRNVTPMKSPRFAETRDSQATWWSAVKLVTELVHAVVCSYVQSHTCNRIPNLNVSLFPITPCCFEYSQAGLQVGRGEGHSSPTVTNYINLFFRPSFNPSFLLRQKVSPPRFIRPHSPTLASLALL